MHVVTMLNQKGGVGKTSSTHHLSGALALGHKLRVLTIDADPQASLTQGWWGPAATRDLDPSRTIAAILGNDLPEPGDVIHPTGVPGISIVPGSRAAKPYNVAEPESMPRDDRETIREFLDEVRADFDVVLIDCPPNLCGCSFAAMAASDYLVVPVQPEDYGAQGVADVLDSLAFVQGEGYHVDLLGFLLTMVSPRQTLHQLYEGNLRDIYRSQIFSARFPRNPEYAEAIAQRQLIQQYKPKGAATKAVKAIADEMLSRIAGTFIAEGVAA